MPETDRPRSARHRRGRLSRRGKVVAITASLALVAGSGTSPVPQAGAGVRPEDARERRTGRTRRGRDPGNVSAHRRGDGEPSRPGPPALAVKVENAPEARPQASLNDADVVVEEPVEGGYTRFIAIFQCGTPSASARSEACARPIPTTSASWGRRCSPSRAATRRDGRVPGRTSWT